MALTIAWDQQALHVSSKEAMSALNGAGAQNPSSSTSWQAPTYRTTRKSVEQPTVPAPSIFQSLGDANDGHTAPLPSVAQCAVHLELLQALHALRVEVLRSTALDLAFGIKPIPRVVSRGRGRLKHEVKLKDNTFADRRKNKWPIFVDFAVVRFQIWVGLAEPILSAGSDLNSAVWANTLPPLDVLMVWHSFLLNPKYFQEYCEEHRLAKIRAVAFPWKSIHNAINASDWSFTLPPSAGSWFRSATDLQPDLLDYLTKQTFSRVVRLVLSKFPSRSTFRDDANRALASGRRLMPGEAPFLRYCISLDPTEKTLTTSKLAEAVERQVSFVDKMEKQLWIRSPALEGTLERAIDRYTKFLKLFKLYPNTMLVPTLDIDLAWHTHQCSPSHYRAGTMEFAARFIDHDDKIGKPTLAVGMEKTKQLFRIRFGQEYLTCNCWDCEAALSAVIMLDRDRDSPDMGVIAHQVSQDVAYYRAVEIARRAGQPLPVRT